jgi:hypothetical protein
VLFSEVNTVDRRAQPRNAHHHLSMVAPSSALAALRPCKTPSETPPVFA